MELFTGESLISQADNGEITLTTHRIWQKSSKGSATHKTSIMLEHITSAEMDEVVKYGYLGVAILALFIAIGSEKYEIGIGAVFFFILYRITKKSYICIKSPSATIQFDTSGLTTESIESIINKIEKAKHERLVKLNKG
jgi:hypothetical protein